MNQQQRNLIATAWWMLDRLAGDDDIAEVVGIVAGRTGLPTSIVWELAEQLR